jgi:hypothetical protein
MLVDDQKQWSVVSSRWSVKKVLSPRLVGAAQVADDLAIDVIVVRLGSLMEFHPHCFGRVVAFAIVAGAAAGDQIIPA